MRGSPTSARGSTAGSAAPTTLSPSSGPQSREPSLAAPPSGGDVRGGADPPPAAPAPLPRGDAPGPRGGAVSAADEGVPAAGAQPRRRPARDRRDDGPAHAHAQRLRVRSRRGG